MPGPLIQRFGTPGLREGDAVAVDGTTGMVYVADAASDAVDVFGLEGPGAPTIEGLSVRDAAPAAADARRFSAQVNPTGSDTHYHFEYGSSSCASAPGSCTASEPVDIGGEGFTIGKQASNCGACNRVSITTAVVAENSFGTVFSPERTFTVSFTARRGAGRVAGWARLGDGHAAG